MYDCHRARYTRSEAIRTMAISLTISPIKMSISRQYLFVFCAICLACAYCRCLYAHFRTEKRGKCDSNNTRNGVKCFYSQIRSLIYAKTCLKLLLLSADKPANRRPDQAKWAGGYTRTDSRSRSQDVWPRYWPCSADELQNQNKVTKLGAKKLAINILLSQISFPVSAAVNVGGRCWFFSCYLFI